MVDQPTNQRSKGVVVGYDESPSSVAALEWAAETARRWGTTLTVLHTADIAAAPVEPAYDVDRLPEAVGEAGRELLADGVARAEKLMTDSSRVVGVLAVGSPAAELVHASADADLVVTGSRGRGPLAAGLLGSVAFAVTAHAACPAVVVRAEPQTHLDHDHPVVVGVDASQPSERALDLAAEMAAVSGAPLHIVHVAHGFFSPDAQAYVESARAGTEHTNAVRAQAEDIVHRAADRARAAFANLPIETEVLYGSAGHVLSPLGEHASLIVVGTRGHGGFAGLLLGSVSHTVIHEAPCPVMIARA
ncbi:universal stress protein [Pedococcus bigeumensis]|uniref:universal stress protein n=1 Tax=Pedococcus bigeumensis TaxID=433644 RepID=UPI002FE8E794